ncbi:predicted protein [Plenodomus lingam JN3]|uniref:Predicted protein n=1 Tax=Leptosphaeria maculans (strain JN3 / isolate v23.1.3 / race Av1-4-5-6-7-8) TaxID=985895 RepID=E4ZWV4_LEPMJ|nr:predicted protein [Plenodomus lingam JN3]CBX96080.1 predicted protein [Plenodomus lingam JN3]
MPQSCTACIQATRSRCVDAAWVNSKREETGVQRGGGL